MLSATVRRFPSLLSAGPVRLGCARPTRSARLFASKIDERENAFEAMEVKKHEEKLLDNLRKKGAQTGQAPAAQTGAAVPPSTSGPKPATPGSSGAAENSSRAGNVSMEEFTAFRSEVTSRLRALDEKVRRL